MGASRADLRRLAMGTLMPGFDGPDLPRWVIDGYAAGLASVCLYGSNVVAPQQLSALCAALREGRPDVVLALDEEGGDVTRLHYRTGSPEPGNAVLGRLDDTRLTRDSAARVGAGCAAYGINLDLAPDVDVNSADSNPVIGVRSFGADPALVARHTAAWVEGLQGSGVAACAKHFPGHGDTVADSHLELPVVDVPLEVLLERELAPFAAAVRAGAAAVMTSHIVVREVDPTQPATFSPTVIRGLLRDRLGFDGVVVTDALDMAGASRGIGIPEAAVRALLAGCDLLCLGTGGTREQLDEIVDAVVAAVDAGRLETSRVAEAAERVARLAADWPVRVGAMQPAAAVDDWSGAFRQGGVVASWRASSAAPVVVQVGTVANQAVGDVAWGPAALGLAVAPDDVPDGAKVAVVGRAIGPGHPAWELADRLRGAGHEVVVVECGWPREADGRLPDLVTFGASRGVARSLVTFLGVGAA